MRLKYWKKWLLGVTICLLSSACQQLTEDSVTSGKGTLNVKTRSVDDEEIDYPLSLFAFSEDGNCVASQIIEDANESIQLNLPAGTYQIVSVSGYSGGYKISENPSLEDVVRMSGESGAETPLMIGRANVTVGPDKESRLEMILSYAVASIDLTLSNVPSDVAEVTVVMSPLYLSMNLKGNYVDADYALKLNCSLNTGNLWSTRNKYVFPLSGTETTLSIVLKLKNGQEVIHGFVWKNAPEVGHPYHLKGKYSDGFALEGDFVMTGWNEAKYVEFTFGVTSLPDGGEIGEGESDLDINVSNLPEVGSIWNGTIVADIIEADDFGVDLLLMSLDEWDATVSEVKDKTFDYAANGILDWRLPTHEEAAILRTTFSGNARVELNERITEYDSELYGLANGEKERYLCLKNGELYSFQFIAGTGTTVAGEKRSYYVRLVKSYHMDF